ncbi:MAG: acyloxyacyl hydrolase [Cytophagales bacterium]|nr:acyloxyacyl hydrolase [Cytophagales bacterium]MDW8384963.1 acyloxyacyl hydrolase [Flammeovirgaceae bacterium]
MCKLLLLLFGIISLPLFSQNYPWIGGSRFHKGFIIPHAEVLREISYSRPWGVEIDISKHITSQHAWNECACYPRIGASIAYFNFANPSILGNAYWITPYVEPTLNTHKKLFFSFRFGAGIVYLDNVYHPQRNPKNHFYSSPISFSLVANSGLNYKITPKCLLRFIANYQHISNGGMSLPNKGINFPTLSIGVDYTPAQEFSPKTTRSLFDLKKSEKKQLWMYVFGSMPHETFMRSKRYPLIGFNTFYKYRISRRSAWAAGFEGYANYALQKSLKSQQIADDFRKIGVLAGHDFIVGRFSFSTYIGAYLYGYILFERIYQRWQLSYRVGKWQYAISLKAHRHIADFLDIRIGYSMLQQKYDEN